MASRIVWVLPSGRTHSQKRTPENEKKAQDYAAAMKRIIYFFV